MTERGPPANNAMSNRGYRRWGSGTAVQNGQILRRAFLRGMACVSEAPHGNHHWADLFAATGCFFVRTVLTGQSSGPDARALHSCSAACAVVCSRSLSCDTAGSSASTGLFLHASAGLQDIHIPHPHIRLLSLPPSSTYIIAFFHLPHPAAAVFAKTFVIKIWGPIQAADPDNSALFD